MKSKTDEKLKPDFSCKTCEEGTDATNMTSDFEWYLSQKKKATIMFINCTNMKSQSMLHSIKAVSSKLFEKAKNLFLFEIE